MNCITAGEILVLCSALGAIGVLLYVGPTFNFKKLNLFRKIKNKF